MGGAPGGRSGRRAPLEACAVRAMLLRRPGTPLEPAVIPEPVPGPGELLLDVRCCGVCRTDLHVLDGDLPEPRVPLVLGHEIVGVVAATGPGTSRFTIGDRVGVPWLGWTCGVCDQCRAGRENLCAQARFTGYQIDGGYAERTVADERYCFPIPPTYNDSDAAPLLCAGMIGYRALEAAGRGGTLGIYGFGAAAHIVTQIATWRHQRVFAFTRPGDRASQCFARDMGASWAGPSDQPGPEPLDAAIIFAPVGALVPAALRAVRPGGTVVCAGIHMSDIPAFRYEALWGERVVRSVANLTRGDGAAFLALAPEAGVTTHVEHFALDGANAALNRVRRGEVRGAAVLVVST
jgi:propanol-preferring alcohol dehydrogenase